MSEVDVAMTATSEDRLKEHLLQMQNFRGANGGNVIVHSHVKYRKFMYSSRALGYADQSQRSWKDCQPTSIKSIK